MVHAEIVDVVSFLPERVVHNAALAAGRAGEADDTLDGDAFFKGVHERRFASPDYQSADLGAAALGRLLERTGTRGEDLDLILCSCIFSDYFWPGIGPAVQHRVGARRATILNVDTSCCSYLSMMNAASAFIASGQYRRVAVVTVTNFISRLPEFQKSRKSWVLGDGASATLLVPGELTILASYERSHGEHYGLFVFQPRETDGCLRNYWEDGSGSIAVDFSPDMVGAIRTNALELVPDAVLRCLARAGLGTRDIDLLVTHQPNTHLLDAWRARLGVGAPRVHDTLARYGNLFQGSIPITLADAVERGKLDRGHVVALGAFSNGGDFVSAMVLRWPRAIRP